MKKVIFTSAVNGQRIAILPSEVAVVYEGKEKIEKKNTIPALTSITLKNGVFYQVIESFDEVLEKT